MRQSTADGVLQVCQPCMLRKGFAQLDQSLHLALPWSIQFTVIQELPKIEIGHRRARSRVVVVGAGLEHHNLQYIGTQNAPRGQLEGREYLVQPSPLEAEAAGLRGLLTRDYPF